MRVHSLMADTTLVNLEPEEDVMPTCDGVDSCRFLLLRVSSERN